ncbi:hypothetical protein [Frondihabitans sp. PAMC 28766]|uniref:hypothetical protein n=1 Tax=Frondihabitans sp. PAMC 28766 TaxID=1795630 RepID=UPI00138F9A8A|nr:hypothetical protein [Frondihabitans sp. PAMC 28766]
MAEVGTMASDNVAEILQDRGAGAPAGPSSAAWAVLADGGWASISADAENGMELREIQEVARTTGRFAVSTPLVATLLAGRWFDLGDDVLDRGAVPLVRRDDRLVAPYFASDVAIVDGEGAVVDAAGVETLVFADLVPLGAVHAEHPALEGRSSPKHVPCSQQWRSAALTSC